MTPGTKWTFTPRPATTPLAKPGEDDEPDGGRGGLHLKLHSITKSRAHKAHAHAAAIPFSHFRPRDVDSVGSLHTDWSELLVP